MLALLVVVGALAAAAAPAPVGAHGEPTATGRPWFVNVTAEAGLADYLHAGWLGEEGGASPGFVESMGPGACWLDADGDGWLDLFLVNGQYHTHPGKNARDPRSALYRNGGNGAFTDVSEDARADLRGDHMGCAAADYDNDGDQDLYVAGYGHSTLLANRGDGRFDNVTDEAGVANERCGDFPCWGSSATWFDYDRDGCLDLHVGNFGDWNLSAPGSSNGPESAPAQVNRLYRSLCDGSFVDVAEAAGVGGKRHSWSSVASDLDGDGWIDLYVSNDGEFNDYFLNNGNGTFRNEWNAARDRLHGMGTAVGDVNHDGRMDVVTTNYVNEPNGIYRSKGASGFDALGETEPFTDGIPWSGWAAKFLDFNNDGRQDLMLLNSMTQATPVLPLKEPVLAYENVDGGYAWNAVDDDLGPGIETDYAGRGGAWGDYDNDGDVDVLVAEAGEAGVHLLRADRTAGNFLNLDLRSLTPGVNRDAVGARVVVEAPGVMGQVLEKYAGDGYLGSNDPRIHVGLGAAESVTVTVRWPDGAVESWSDLRANSFLRLTQGDPRAEVVRELPLVRILGPVVAERRVPLEYRAEALTGGGAAVTSVTWDFGDGGAASGTSATHEFTDVGTLHVRATITDALGRAKTHALRVLVTDVITADVDMDRDEFLPHENASGVARVTYSDGSPVRDATVSLRVQYSAGDAGVDAATARLPRFARTAAGYYEAWVNGTTDAAGELRFDVPQWVRSPTPLAPSLLHQPGHYTVYAAGSYRGIELVPATGEYRVAPTVGGAA